MRAIHALPVVLGALGLGVGVVPAGAAASTTLTSHLASPNAVGHPSLRRTVTLRAPTVILVHTVVQGRLAPRFVLQTGGACPMRFSIQPRLRLGAQRDGLARVRFRQGGRTLAPLRTGTGPRVLDHQARWRIGQTSPSPNELLGWWAAPVDPPGSDGRRVFLDFDMGGGTHRLTCTATAAGYALDRVAAVVRGLEVRVTR